MAETTEAFVPKVVNNDLKPLPRQGVEPLKTQGLQRPPVQTGVQRPPKPVSPQRNITLQDFLSEADKISRRKAQLAAQPILETFEKGQESFASKLHGQNVGASSGVGQQLQAQQLENFGKRLEPVAERIGLESAQNELNFRRQDTQQLLNQQFDLVQSGQITGDQATQILQEKGISPESFMTPQQLQLKQEQEEFKTRLSDTIKDPEVAQLIESQSELNFYLEFGKTFEEEVADIAEKSESLAQWKAKLPELQTAFNLVSDNLRRESANFFKNDRTISELTEQREALKEVLSSIDAGVAPSSAGGSTVKGIGDLTPLPKSKHIPLEFDHFKDETGG